MIRALTLALTLVLTPLAFAQEGTPEGDKPTPQADGQDEDNGEGRRRGRRGMGRRGMQLPVERFKEELGLTEEQVAQLEALNAEMQEQGQKLREMFQNGDMEGAREMMQGFRTKMQDGLKSFLTEEQQEKAKELMQRGRERFGRRGRGGRGGPQNKARLRDEAVKALALGEEEAAVVLPRLDTVLDTRELLQREQETRRQDFLKKARETSDGDALNALLAEFRTAREADKEQVKAAMDQLREVLTLEQEVKLVGLNVLD